MDYTKFLNRTEHVVLAYLGGPYAYGKDRRFRIDEPRPDAGFHRFEVRGRNARAIEAVEAPEPTAFDGLARARGHHVGGWLVASELERLQLLPSEELSPLAIVRGRRWHSGDLLFASQDYDGDVEEEARLRLEKLEALAGTKGAPPSLRVAYGIALSLAVARREGLALSPREARHWALRVADEGEPTARAFIADVRRERALAAARVRRPVVPSREPTLDDAPARAEAALDAANARMLSSRRLDGGSLEVAFAFMGERFVSVVDAITLQVYDAGVCLSGEDELVTLESLPGVIREAIDTEVLVITRR